MDNKAFKLGIIVGRFQTFHIGHECVVNKASQLCERVGIFIGSSQEEGTLKNPFSYEMRKDILQKIFGDSVYIYPLPDIGVGNNSTWGDYVLENVEKRFGMLPDLLISGKEERRISWFDGVAGVSVSELYIPKTIDISATQMRDHLINGEFELWKEYTNNKLWSEYDKLRECVCAAKDNLYTDSI